VSLRDLIRLRVREEVARANVARQAAGPGAYADRVEVGDRWVRVRGNLNTYKIHIGSGNILVEPDDRYLCIVASWQWQPSVLLPFEDDEMLSVILSKMTLLAADDTITDPQIVEQLRDRP
jgi:hypothetical protein